MKKLLALLLIALFLLSLPLPAARGDEGEAAPTAQPTEAPHNKPRRTKSLKYWEEEELPGIDAGMLKEAYQTILEIAGSMDYGLMESLLKDLRGYRLPEEDRDRIGKIEERLTELDWEGIGRIAGERG